MAWTPQGYYASSPNGDKYIGWHINRGVDKLAEYYGAAQYKKTFYRPDVVAEFLEVRDIERALERANAARPGPAPAVSRRWLRPRRSPPTPRLNCSLLSRSRKKQRFKKSTSRSPA